MNEKGDRLAKLVDEAAGRGVRYTAADRHVECWETAREITGIKEPARSLVYASFLAGWDAALETTYGELMEENQALHGMIFDLCHRLCVKRCERCRGSGIDDKLEPCPHCDGGWIDQPISVAENVIEEIKQKRKDQ